jgi:hypothetical protein
MELLDRYLQAVRKYLPAGRQDDIAAELRANMESQIEDKESELGRSLSNTEVEDLLKKMGSPVLVASRYQRQQYLIGPTFFPIYMYVLRVAILWTLIIYSVVVAVVLPFTAPNTTSVVNSLFQIPSVLVMVAGWVTLVFAAIEFFTTRYPEKCPTLAGYQWNPSSLPPLEKVADHGRKPRSFAKAVAEIVIGFLALAWLLLIPRYPFLLMGPGVVVLQILPFQLAPIWWTAFWWIVGLDVLQLGWKCIELSLGKWQYPSRIQHMIFQAVGAIPLIVLLSVRDHVYVVLKNPLTGMVQYADDIATINWSIRLGIGVICAIVVLQLIFESGRLAWNTYRNRGTAL